MSLEDVIRWFGLGRHCSSHKLTRSLAIDFHELLQTGTDLLLNLQMGTELLHKRSIISDGYQTDRPDCLFRSNQFPTWRQNLIYGAGCQPLNPSCFRLSLYIFVSCPFTSLGPFLACPG